MTVYLGSDHRGFALKSALKRWLTQQQIVFVDVGNDHLDPRDDYVDFSVAVARKVAGTEDKGIVICGSGVGVDVTANKIAGIRCGLGFTPEEITAARRDDDINVLALSSDSLTEEQAQTIVQSFLKTPFDGGEKYQRRIDKITDIEQ